MSARKIRVGAWELHHHVLRPSRCLLQTHSQRLQQAITPPQDPLITFRLTAHPPTPHPPPKDDTPRTVAVHRSLLRAAGGPLEALVTAPFAESEMSEIVIHETFECFDVVRRFLYCEPIHMLNLPLDLPLVADRWGLSTLFEACFTHAEERAHAHAGVPKLSVAELIIKYIPIMAIVDVPDRFKTYLALRLGIEIKTIDSYFKKHPVTPTSMDDICCVDHDDSVTCRRRRSNICAGKGQQPCTRIVNASAQSASVKCMGELMDENDENGSLAEGEGKVSEAAEITPQKEEEKNSTAETQSAKMDDVNGIASPGSTASKDEATGSTAEEKSAAPEENELDSTSSDPPREADDGANEPPPPTEVTTTDTDQVSPKAAEGGTSTDDIGDNDAGPVQAQSQAASTSAELQSVEAAHESPDAVDQASPSAEEVCTAVGNNVASGDVDDAVADDAVANDVGGAQSAATSTSADPPSIDATHGSSDAPEQASSSADEASIHEGSISDVSGPEDNTKEEKETSDSEKDDDEEEIEDLMSSETPQRSDWHDNFNVWEVFQSRSMLDEVIHYLSHYGPDDYTPLVLDVVLRILEPKLSDEEITRLLREIDWDWENPSCQTLNSKSAGSWSARAWRLLACARVGFSGSGSDIRMSWNYSDLFRDMHARATELANRSNNDTDSDTSHSSVDDDTDFTVDWEGKAGDEHFDFSMSLQCDCMAMDHLSSLNLRIRLIEKEDAPLDKQTGRREVSARIKVIESGCGCDLQSAPNDRTYQGFTASPVKNMESRTTLWSYKDSGVNYKVMCSEDLASWMKRHKKQCGLVFQVRVYVYPLEDDEDEKKKPARQCEEIKTECTCGFCECDGCGPKDEEDEQEEN